MGTKRIFVIGSANTDVVLSLTRPIEDGQCIIANSQNIVAGGKGANRAVALRRLGENPRFSCCIGTDTFGNALYSLFESEKLDTVFINRTDAAGTGTAYIMLDAAGNNRIVVYPGANSLFGSENINKIIDCLDDTSFLSMEFEIPLEAVERLNYEAIKHGVPTVIDAGPIRDGVPSSVFKGAYILSPNETEAEAITGISIDSIDDAKKACRALFEYNTKYALIKLGSMGSVCYDGTDYIICKPFDTGLKVTDTTGAGDSYMSGLVKALSHGQSMEKSMQYASIVAGIAVTRFGAIPSMPFESEVASYNN